MKVKNTDQILWMRRAGMVVTQIHQVPKTACEPGTITGELDQVSAAVIVRMEAKSSFLDYDGFPVTVCISVNEEAIYGIPGNRVLQFDDPVSFDCRIYVLDCNNRQWHADAVFTMVCGGEEHACPEDLQLMTTTQYALQSGIAALTKAQHLGEIGGAVGEVAYEDSLRSGWEAGAIEEYVGHGIDTSLYQAPDVLNFPARSRGPKIKTGMILAIESMPARGGVVTKELADGWMVVAVDGSRMTHSEHTVAVLPGGVWVLIKPDGGRSGLAPFGLSLRAIAPKG